MIVLAHILAMPVEEVLVPLASGAGAGTLIWLAALLRRALRMQWFMAEYAQEVSDAKKLGIRFFAVLPRQRIEGTEIGPAAAANHGATPGSSAAEFLKRR